MNSWINLGVIFFTLCWSCNSNESPKENLKLEKKENTITNFDERLKKKLESDYEEYFNGEIIKNNFKFSITKYVEDGIKRSTLMYSINDENTYTGLTPKEHYVENYWFDLGRNTVTIKYREDSNQNGRYEYFFDEVKRYDINLDTLRINFFERLENMFKE